MNKAAAIILFYSILFYSILFYSIFVEIGEGRKKERERNIDVRAT